MEQYRKVGGHLLNLVLEVCYKYGKYGKCFADVHNRGRFQVGDDLRQDMLTMQLIGIMDRLWLQHGLDLKIVTFKCQATAVKRGQIYL